MNANQQHFTETFSITWGDQAENHHGMQRLGKLAAEGFTCQDFRDLEIPGKEIIDLTQFLPESVRVKDDYEASLLVIRNGVDLLLGEREREGEGEGMKDKLFKEIKELPVDKKGLMRGRVVHKLARWNNCFADEAQEPDYTSGKGTVIAFKDVPFTNQFRQALPTMFGEKARNLLAETNHYYDLNKCGIGFHGDSERKIVICARFGASMSMEFQWFQQSRAVGTRFHTEFHHGDLYVMSEKATGHDWKKRKVHTLRHAAGSDKFLKIN